MPETTTILSKFEGTCPACYGHINAGDELTLVKLTVDALPAVSKLWVHSGCAGRPAAKDIADYKAHMASMTAAQLAQLAALNLMVLDEYIQNDAERALTLKIIASLNDAAEGRWITADEAEALGSHCKLFTTDKLYAYETATAFLIPRKNHLAMASNIFKKLIGSATTFPKTDADKVNAIYRVALNNLSAVN